MRTLYTWHGKDYTTTRYAHPEERMLVSWCWGRGTDLEASGTTKVQAQNVQEFIQRIEGDLADGTPSSFVIESIQAF